jgi:hypothetical protein
MPQKLFVKQPAGGTRAVTIIRIFKESSGREVYHHSNGRYAYKDGSPLKNGNELAVIGDRTQRA